MAARVKAAASGAACHLLIGVRVASVEQHEAEGCEGRRLPSVGGDWVSRWQQSAACDCSEFVLHRGVCFAECAKAGMQPKTHAAAAIQNEMAIATAGLAMEIARIGRHYMPQGCGGEEKSAHLKMAAT
jgi:hypothetical protein